MSFVDADDVSLCYADMWQHVEHSVQRMAQQEGKPLPDRCFGRGQRSKPCHTRFEVTPVGAGRSGDVRPSFLGFSHIHRLWFRQLRRLQSFCRLVRHGVHSWASLEHRAFLWTSILNANGFRPGFATWWTLQGYDRVSGVGVTDLPPPFEVAHKLFEAFQVVVQDFESHLKQQQRYKSKISKTRGIGTLYKEVRRDPPDPVSVLVQSTVAKVTGVDHDTQALEFAPHHAWSDTAPLRHQGRDIVPIVVTEDKIWCDTVEGVAVGDTIAQTQCTGRLRDLFEAFHDQWRVRWLKHRSVEPSQWTDILAFADATLFPVNAAPPSLDVASLRRMISLKSRRSACGLDGVSVADLRAMDDGQLQSLVSLFHRAEHDGSWPLQCMAGSVQSLAKKPTPQHPGDYRPVTVLSLVYRLWSSCHSRHWLKALAPAIDQHLCGNRPGHCPADVWRWILNAVTEAHSTDQLACGFVVDLVKAYNTLPRYPVLYAAKLLGVAQSTLVAWSGALSLLCRHFAVRNSFSSGLGSTTGLPEGCGLSCLGMLVLDVVLHRWMSALDVSIQTLSFVDNWEILICNEELLDRSFARMEAFVAMLDLELDSKKTFFWSTSKAHRARLRAQGKVVQNSSKDLGAHMAYTQQLSNHYLTPRILDLETFWERMVQVGGTHAQRVCVVRSAAWPRAFHACSSSSAVVGRRFLDGLRTQCMKALRLDRPGASSWLQFALEPDGTDPLMYMIWSTLRDFRADRSMSLLPPSGCVEFESTYIPGSLLEILVQRVHFLGWRIAGTTAVEDALGVFDLREVALQELSLRVHFAWTRVVAQKVGHRASLVDFHRVDRHQTRLGLLQFPDYAQGILRRHLNGSQCTNAAACFWSSSGSTDCIMCGCRDSVFHRLWECPASASFRSSVPSLVLDHVREFPAVLSVHGWTLQSPFWKQWQLALLALPLAIPRPLVSLQPGTIVDFCIEGSCLWQDQIAYRVASWAVILSAPLGSSRGFAGCSILAAGPLSGLVQSSYRAELMALRAACHYAAEAGLFARVWTDCLSVLSRFQSLTQGTKTLQMNSPHADLWTGILESVARCEKGGLVVLRVPAHRKLEDAGTDLERWMIIGNDVADAAAKRANLERSKEFWQLWQQHSTAVDRNTILAGWIREHMVRVATLWTEVAAIPSEQSAPRLVRRRELPPIVWLGVGRLQPVGSQFVKLFTPQIQDRMAGWVDSIWDASSVTEWISFAQLFVLCQLQLGLKGVIRRGRRWTVLSSGDGTTPEQYRFSLLCRGFRMMLQALFKACSLKIHACTTRPHSCYLQCHVGCLAIPLKLEYHEQVELWLSTHLRRPLRGTQIELPMA